MVLPIRRFVSSCRRRLGESQGQAIVPVLQGVASFDFKFDFG